MVEIALLKLASSAKTFYKGCPELHVDGLTWQEFNTVFRNRYKDVQMDQYHYMNSKRLDKRKARMPRRFPIDAGS